MTMKISREESTRIHQEFEKFYAKHPRLRVQANHRIFLDAAQEDGGSEVLTAEWLELQLDSLRGQLAVLQETPDEALNKFMAENPAYDFEANRRAIAERVRQTHETVEQAVSALGTQLAFNQQVANEQTAQNEAQEREELARYIAKTHTQGVSGFAQELHYKKNLQAPLEYLRNRAAEIRERTKLSAMSAKDLKAHIRRQREEQAPPATELPAEVTLEKFRQMSKEEIQGLARRYGWELLNKRFGYKTPEIQGLVRKVNLEALTTKS